MELLPNELIDLVCKWLTLKEMGNLSSTDKYFRQLIDQNQFYSFCKVSFDTNDEIYICNIMRHFSYFCRFYSCYPKKYDNFGTFRIACREGHLAIAKWLIKIYPYIVFSENCEIDFAFINACSSGHLKTAKWLIRILPTINIQMNIDVAFKWTCKKGHLETAKWLTTMCPNYVITQELPEILYEIKNRHPNFFD